MFLALLRYQTSIPRAPFVFCLLLSSLLLSFADSSRGCARLKNRGYKLQNVVGNGRCRYVARTCGGDLRRDRCETPQGFSRGLLSPLLGKGHRSLPCNVSLFTRGKRRKLFAIQWKQMVDEIEGGRRGSNIWMNDNEGLIELHENCNI